jgi:hypothetical protein
VLPFGGVWRGGNKSLPQINTLRLFVFDKCVLSLNTATQRKGLIEQALQRFGRASAQAVASVGIGFASYRQSLNMHSPVRCYK